MDEIISLRRQNGGFRLDIELEVESVKAAEISGLVAADAGETEIGIGSKRRLRRLSAHGIVTPMTAREILRVLAA